MLWGIVLTYFLTVPVSILGSAFPESKSEPLSNADRESLLKVAVDLRTAILREDINGILQHVSTSQGLSCTDTQYSYQEVKKDLHNKNSHLYICLFDTVGFSKMCGHQYPAEYPAISDKEFFSKAEYEPIEIKSMKVGWAIVTYTSKTRGHYPREYTFHKEQGEWKLTYGVIIGSCG